MELSSRIVSGILLTLLLIGIVTTIFLSPIVVRVLAIEGNSKVRATKRTDESWLGAVEIEFVDPDGLSKWVVYDSSGRMMQMQTYSSPYPTNSSSALGGGAVPMYIEGRCPLKIKVEDKESAIDWWKVYEDLHAEGPFEDKTGYWIKYDYTATGAPAGTPLPLWIKVEFLSTQGINATVRVTMHMSNGTEQNQTMNMDVLDGGGTLGTLSGFVIPANRTTGDSVYISGYGNVTIDGETTRTYAGASRTVVYASFSQYGTQLTYYWDKETGIMVEASVTSGSMTGTAKATETNMWQAAPSGLAIEPTYLYILTAVIIVIAAATIALIIRRKREPQEKLQLKPT